MANSERFHPDFSLDLAAALNFYDEISVTHGDRFRELLNARLDFILSYPESFAPIYRDVRPSRMPTYPYVILYQYRPNIVYFIALAHGSSDRNNWFVRLPR